MHGFPTFHAMVAWWVVHNLIAHAAKVLGSTSVVNHGVCGTTNDRVRAAMGIIPIQLNSMGFN